MVRRPVHCLVAACVAALAAALAPAAWAEPPAGVAATGVIEGRLLDGDGHPVPGLDVVVSGAPLAGARRVVAAAADGQFRFEGLPVPGAYVLTSGTSDGIATARAPITLDGRQTARVELRLVLGFSDAVTVTGTREGQLKRETPATVDTVTRAKIEETHPGHPSEVMGQIPGVWVNTTGGEGHMTAIRQPLTTNPVYLYLEDGVPTRSTGFFNHNALYEVDLPDAGGIEVTKGPGSALYGSDAIGGVVNVITQPGLGPPGIDGTLEAGGFGWRRLLASGRAASAGSGLRLSLNLTRSDGWRDATGYDRQGGSARWDRAGAATRWKTLASFSHIDQQTAGSSTLQTEDYLFNPSRNLTPISFRKVTAVRVSGEYERAAGAHLVSVVPYARYNTMGLLPNWSLTYDPTVYTTRNTSFGLLAKYRRDFAPWRTQVIAGFDLDVSPGGHLENQIVPQTEKTPNNKTMFVGYSDGPVIYDYEVTYLGAAPYVQADFSPAGRLRASAGVRLDTIRYAYTDNLTTPPSPRYQRPADTTLAYGHTSPKLGLTWQASDTINVFASYRHAFRVPSEGQLFRQGATRNTVDLKPVRADNVEIGVRATPIRELSVQVSAYRLDKRDDILSFRNPIDGYTDNVNAGHTLHQGIEVGVDLTPARWSRLSVAYSHARHTYETWVVDPLRQVDYSGNEMETAPRNLGSTALTVTPGHRALASVEAILLGRYWMDAANTQRYGGHTLFNLRGQVSVRKDLTVFARVLNVANRRYAESSSYTTARGPEFAPGRPRTVFVGVEMGWRQ